MILELQENGMAVVSSQHDLISLKEAIPKSNEDIQNPSTRSLVGVVSETSKNGVSVRFLDGLKKLVLVKELETAQDYQNVYKLGSVVRVAKNKVDRLTLKKSIVYYSNTDLLKSDKEIQIRTHYEDVKDQIQVNELKIGEKVQAEISLVKDYGNIVAVEKYPGLTGFVLTEHLNSGKTYKEG